MNDSQDQKAQEMSCCTGAPDSSSYDEVCCCYVEMDDGSYENPCAQPSDECCCC